VRFCETLEDTDRGLKQTDTEASILNRKIYSLTAIPTGTYEVSMNIVSPKYAAIKSWRDFNEGKMPRIMDVKGFSGVLIHTGNSALDTYGCVLVGENKKVGRLLNSRRTFEKLYRKMKAAADRKEKITLDII
jgi:hypothetical protein